MFPILPNNMKMKAAICLLFTFLACYLFANTSFRPGKDYALFFAVDKYKHLDDLKNPVADAQKLAGKLRAGYEFETEVVENPTRKEVKEKLEHYRDQFEKGIFPQDGQLFLFFSGHGVFESASNNGFFIPSDGDPRDLQATAIPYSYWRPFIDRFNCKHILVVIDACFSGTFDQKIVMKSADTETDPVFNRPKELTEKERLIQNHREHITRLYLSSSAIEKTPDRSTFSKKLYKALDEGGHRDGLLTAGEVYELYLKSVRPTPIFGEFGQDQAGSSFLFFPKEAEDVVAISRSEKEVIDHFQTEVTVWRAAQNKNTISAYDDYLRQFPDGSFATAAEAERERLGAEYILSGNRMFDKRDGQTYQVVWIDGKAWMAENLNYEIEGSYCYKDKEANCEEYGRLYTWEAAMKACPKGWRLPRDEEWRALVISAGGYFDWQLSEHTVGDAEKSYWELTAGEAGGFSAFLGGLRDPNGDYFYLGQRGYYWSNTKFGTDSAWDYNFDGDSRQVYRDFIPSGFVLSCRCLKN